MLVSYLAKKQNELAATWDKKRALLKTAADVEARNAFVREKVVQMLRGFPEKNRSELRHSQSDAKRWIPDRKRHVPKPTGFLGDRESLCSNFWQRSFSGNHFALWALPAGPDGASIPKCLHQPGEKRVCGAGLRSDRAGRAPSILESENKRYRSEGRARRMSIPCPVNCNY